MEGTMMIVEENKIQVEKQGIQKDAYFNIKQENVAHIFSILRNQLYSDKIMAVIREYSTNAIDAHVENNVEQPFEITIPTPFKPEFIIRDFGKGLSQEDVIEIFASYGESTKRHSNSFTGMLGLGSKSAFAYASAFTVISRYEGNQYTYQAYIDETNVGTISLISTVPTNESGVSVHISVKPQDCTAFQNKCVEFFTHAEILPRFINFAIQKKINENKDKDVLMKGDCWKIIKGWSHNIVFHMGNVPYTVNKSTVLEMIPNDYRRGFFDGEWHITVPIGSIVPSASRESLELNEKTTSYIAKKVLEIRREIQVKALDTLNSKPSLYLKKTFASNFISTFRDMKFKEMEQEAYPFTTGQLLEYGLTKVRVETSKLKFSEGDRTNIVLPVKDNPIFFLDSSDITRISVRPRILAYCEENNIKGKDYHYSTPAQHLFILSFKSDKHREEFIKHPDFKGCKMVDLKTINFTISKKSSGVGRKGEVGELFYYESSGRVNFDKWKARKEAPQKSVWVEISNFMPKKYGNSNEFLSDLERCLNVNLKTKTDIYGVKTADRDNVPDDWVELKTHFIKAVQNYKKEKNDVFRAFCKYWKLNGFWASFITQSVRASTIYPPFKKVYQEYNLFSKNVSELEFIEQCCNRLGIEFYKEQEVPEITKLKKDIPLLTAFENNYIEYPKLHERITELL